MDKLLHVNLKYFLNCHFRDSHLSLLSSTGGLVKFPPKHILNVANLIIKKCAHYLNIIRNEFTPEQIQNNQSINNAPCLTNLIPFTLAHLSHLTDPEVNNNYRMTFI